MKKILHSLAAVAWLACSHSAPASVLITGFGSPSDFTVEGFSTFSTITPGSNSVTVSGTTTQQLFGSFGTVDISGFTGLLRLEARVIGTNPGDLITLTLFDSNFESQSYQASLGLFGSGTMTPVDLPILGTLNSSLLLDSITGLSVSFGGNEAVSMEFGSLSAIPEPSTAALLILTGLGTLALRRHRARQAAQ